MMFPICSVAPDPVSAALRGTVSTSDGQTGKNLIIHSALHGKRQLDLREEPLDRSTMDQLIDGAYRGIALTNW